MALPSSAAAHGTCPPEPFIVHADGDSVHACVDLPGNGWGGEAEFAKNGSYGWVDGDDSNPANSAGYVGFNNGGISDTNKDTNCDGVDEGGGNNSGGCFWIKGAPAAVNAALQNPVTAMFMCGNTSGPDHRNSTRDGCSIP